MKGSRSPPCAALVWKATTSLRAAHKVVELCHVGDGAHDLGSVQGAGESVLAHELAPVEPTVDIEPGIAVVGDEPGPFQFVVRVVLAEDLDGALELPPGARRAHLRGVVGVNTARWNQLVGEFVQHVKVVKERPVVGAVGYREEFALVVGLFPARHVVLFLVDRQGIVRALLQIAIVKRLKRHKCAARRPLAYRKPVKIDHIRRIPAGNAADQPLRVAGPVKGGALPHDDLDAGLAVAAIVLGLEVLDGVEREGVVFGAPVVQSDGFGLGRVRTSRQREERKHYGN